MCRLSCRPSLLNQPSLSRCQNDQCFIGEQILADVTVTLVEESWLEQHFLATEALGANNDDVSVCELEGKRHALANPLEDGRAT